MIVTLAGHVDHGKTSLVHALTGINTDTLAEEQRRGLTIDLGFAYTTIDGQRIGFVDVPGHHRFIHNMVAGVAAHQHALVVVAVDDGVMPQTLEHVAILKLLGVTHGVAALTKVDRADAGRVADVRQSLVDLAEAIRSATQRTRWHILSHRRRSRRVASAHRARRAGSPRRDQRARISARGGSRLRSQRYRRRRHRYRALRSGNERRRTGHRAERRTDARALVAGIGRERGVRPHRRPVRGQSGRNLARSDRARRLARRAVDARAVAQRRNRTAACSTTFRARSGTGCRFTSITRRVTHKATSRCSTSTRVSRRPIGGC